MITFKSQSRTTRQDYFDTFENNFKDKYEELLEQVAIIGAEIAPILYEKVESVTGEKPDKVIKGVLSWWDQNRSLLCLNKQEYLPNDLVQLFFTLGPKSNGF